MSAEDPSRLAWLAHRLRAMSPQEVGFRLWRKAQSRVERSGWGLARPQAARGECGRPWVQPLPRRFPPARYAAAADRILEGRFHLFALSDAPLGFPPRWNVDPKTGIEAPAEFGKSLDYRNRRLAGDAKYLWELNRHLELVALAQAWHLSGDERYAQGAQTLLESWLAQCPYPRGLNWCVSLESAVRLVNWSFAWHLLGGEASVLFAGKEGRSFRERWLASVYQHCHFIAGHASRHSSANNHLIGEATGLLAGALTWPLWRESVKWRDRAHRELAREALEQNFRDGVNREQAIWYHHAVADMMLIAGLLARANGCDFEPPYWRRLEAMIDFLSSLMDVGGNVPAIGDADDGVLVRLGASRDHRELFRSLLVTGAVLWQRSDLAAQAAALSRRSALDAQSAVIDDKTRWLLGDDAEASFAALAGATSSRKPRATVQAERDAEPPAERNSEPRAPIRAFFEGGYFVLGEAFGTRREIRIVADAGPLGYLAIAAHGHADALSFTLSAAGSPMLVDPGTGSYDATAPWRHYFRGTSAHNTVTVDGEDQSLYRGGFLWHRHAEARVEQLDLAGPVQTLVARHDGYMRLPDPVLHRRTWSYAVGEGRLTVVDEVECKGTHHVALQWHFAPECRVSAREGAILAERSGVRLQLTGPASLASQIVMGSEDPPLGWFSPSFDVQIPAPSVTFSGPIAGGARLVSTVLIGCL